jgi:hypothetical protein
MWKHSRLILSEKKSESEDDCAQGLTPSGGGMVDLTVGECDFVFLKFIIRKCEVVNEFK